jgi:hypothetical protein
VLVDVSALEIKKLLNTHPRLKNQNCLSAKIKLSISISYQPTMDLGGRLRFGPDVEYVDTIDYKVDISKKDAFLLLRLKTVSKT